jgi:hypothetical protein
LEYAEIDVPAMYGDHHVTEVRRILLQLGGVCEVNASSCFHAVRVGFDPRLTGQSALAAALAAAGYLQPLQIPTESELPAGASGRGAAFYRHSAAFEPGRPAVQFTQRVEFSGRPLWPCPGMGVIAADPEAERG